MKMSTRLNRAVTADAVANDDDMTKMLIVSYYEGQSKVSGIVV